MDLVGIANIPGSHSGSVVVGYRLSSSGKLGSLGIECVAVRVHRAPNRFVGGNSICHIDSVLRPVDTGIDSETKKMLVIVRIDTFCFGRVSSELLRLGWCWQRTWIHLGAPSIGIFSRIDGIRVQNSRQLDFWLNCAILLEEC